MKLMLMTTMFIISHISSRYFQPSDGNTIIKYSEEFYQLHSKENFEDVNIKIKERFNAHKKKKNSNRLKAHRKNYEGNSTAEAEFEISNLELHDIIVRERDVKIFVTNDHECNVNFQETILYEQHENNSNYIEHLVLNSNYDYIDSNSLKSDDIQIDFFAFNQQLNLFSIFYENPKNYTKYTIHYDYSAINLIKSKKSQNITEVDQNYNYIVWKLYNENTENIKQKLSVQYYFNLDKNFANETVRFVHNNSTMNFTKNLFDNNETTGKTMLYEWNGSLSAQEVLVINTKFPMYFDNCQIVMISVPIIIAGSIFILFLIFVLYIILSQLLWFEN